MRLSSASAQPAARAEAAESASATRAATGTRSGRRRIAAGLYGSIASEDLQEGEAQDDARLPAVPAGDGRAGVESHERGPRPRHLAGEACAAEVGPVERGRGVPDARVLVEDFDAEGVAEDVAVRELRDDGLLGPERIRAKAAQGSSTEEPEAVLGEAVRVARAEVGDRSLDALKPREVEVLRELERIRPVLVFAGAVVRVAGEAPRIPARALVPRGLSREGPPAEVPGDLPAEGGDPVVGRKAECGRGLGVGREIAMGLAERRRELQVPGEGNPCLEVPHERARLHALDLVLRPVHVQRVGAADRHPEDVDAGVDRGSEEARLVVRGGQEDSAEEDLELLVPLLDVEVDLVHAQERERIVEGAVVEDAAESEQVPAPPVLGDGAPAVLRLLEIPHALFR